MQKNMEVMTMTVQEMYQQKLTTADEAVKVVKSGGLWLVL